jgi:hypothetical protein
MLASLGDRLTACFRRVAVAGPLTAVVLGLLAVGSARAEEWTDVQGKSFDGTAVEALGPFALFTIKPTVGRWVPMQALPLPELARFSRAVKDHPARAKDWAEAKSTVTSELRDHLLKFDTQKLVPLSVAGRQEPAVIVVLFLNHASGDNWKVIWPSMDSMGALAKQTPRMVEFVVYGTGYTSSEWFSALKDASYAPWLLVDPEATDKLPSLQSYAPRDGYGMIALSRDGVPLFGAKNPDEDGVKEIWKKVTEFAALLDPAQPYAWKPLAYYRTAEHIAAHPTGRVEPEIVGSPIRAGALARHNVHAFTATLKVGADGGVTDVTDIKSETPIAPKVNDAIVKALKLAVVVPAIENGTPVASDYTYHYTE